MIVFMDIDGCIADWRRRLKKAGPEPKKRGPKYEAWLKIIQSEESLLKDPQVAGMSELCWKIAADGDLVYLTARSVKFREVTKDWLHDNAFPWHNTPLRMRPIGSKSKSGHLKQQLIKEYLEDIGMSESVLVIDDDPNGDVEKMCKRNGYTFLKARSASVD